jgi:quinol monooxygenase YgiN
MTTISKEHNFLTFINVFIVEPANQPLLIDLLTQATQIVRQQPGFISSALHRSLDGTKVTMYAQWQSLDYYNAMRGNPAAAPFLQQAMQIATFDPGIYEVVEVF